MSFSVTVPYEVSLCRPDGWRRAASRDREFSVLRLHYHLRSRPHIGSLQVGPPLADITTAPGTQRVDEDERTYEVQVTDERATVRKILTELEAARTFVDEVAAKVSLVASLDLSARGLSEETSRLRQEASEEVRAGETVRRTVSWRLRQSLSVDGEKSGSPLYLVSSYRRIGYDVHLVFVDCLTVRYERQGMQIRSRRNKLPPAPLDGRHWRQAANVSATLNIPIKTLWFYELVENRCPQKVGDYEPEVTKPHAVDVSTFDSVAGTYPLPTEDVRSLYKLSNAAFPLKWSDELAASEP